MANDVVVGFIGLGTMGGRMATNILKAGYKVVVHDLHRQSAGHHLQAGAEWADTPRALAEKSDVIFTSLPEPADVERVSLAADGLIEGVKKGAAYFDLSTNAQSVVKKIHEAFAAQALSHIKALESPEFLRDKAGVTGLFGAFPRDRMNPNGGSVALGHPFGATGARIISQAVKELSAKPAGSRAIVSICTDGGQGSVVLLEAGQ